MAKREFWTRLTRVFSHFVRLENCSNQSGYKILEDAGHSCAVSESDGRQFHLALFLRVNRALIRLSRGLFSYQIFVRAEAKPTVNNLLGETIEGSAALQKKASLSWPNEVYVKFRANGKSAPTGTTAA